MSRRDGRRRLADAVDVLDLGMVVHRRHRQGLVVKGVEGRRGDHGERRRGRAEVLDDGAVGEVGSPHCAGGHGWLYRGLAGPWQ